MNEGIQRLTSKCGHHCGVKDGIEGHCNCVTCHDGKLERDTVQTSITDKVIPKDFKGD